MVEMQKWEAELEASKLGYMSPEAIYAYLESLPRPASEFHDNLHEDVLSAISSRNDPLIRLGLARYSTNSNLLQVLWWLQEPGLRLAILANRNRGPVMPTGEWGDTVERLTETELAALYANERIWPALLERTFTNELGLSEERSILACRLGMRNERLRHQLKENSWDDFTENMEHLRPVYAVWDMFVDKPVTPDWALVLEAAGFVEFEVRLPKDRLPDLKTEEGRADWKATSARRYEEYRAWLTAEVQRRWQAPEGEEPGPDGPYFWARAAYAEAVCRKNEAGPRSEFAQSEDQAFRCGFYRAGRVTEEWPVYDYSDRDEGEFLDSVIYNPTLYERTNCYVFGRVRGLAVRRPYREDHRVKAIDNQLARMVAKDPAKYGDEPTDAMRREEQERWERETRAAWSAPPVPTQPSEPEAPPRAASPQPDIRPLRPAEPSPATRAWGKVGMWVVIAVGLAAYYLVR